MQTVGAHEHKEPCITIEESDGSKEITVYAINIELNPGESNFIPFIELQKSFEAFLF